MGKKGFLLAEETLKIILSVIAITFLVYFLMSLYNGNKDAKDLELAQASLEHLMEEINAKSPVVDIYNPKGWGISVWPHDVMRGILFFKKHNTEMPLSCFNLGWEECICICEDEGEEECDDLGYCLETENISMQEYIPLTKEPAKLNIVYEENMAIITG